MGLPVAKRCLAGGRPSAGEIGKLYRHSGLMPRIKTGSVFEKPWADGQTISYRAYVYAYGQREKSRSAPTSRDGTASGLNLRRRRSCSRSSEANGCRRALSRAGIGCRRR